MIAATIQEQKQAKLKFFGAYAASLILAIAIFASLWKNEPQTTEITKTSTEGADNKLVQTETILHKKTQQLDGLYALWVKEKAGRNKTLLTLQSAEASFKLTLDSLEREVLKLDSEAQKKQMNDLITNFRTSLESRSVLQSSYAVILNDTTEDNVTATVPQNPGPSLAEMEGLKEMLVQKEQRIATLQKDKELSLQEKDRTISSLTTQLKQKAPAEVITKIVPGNSNDGEWRQKHAKLKASYDNLEAQNTTLNKSYKLVVEDNRRLLSQLQTSKRE